MKENEVFKDNFIFFKRRFMGLSRLLGFENYEDAKVFLENIPKEYKLISTKKNKNLFTLCINEKFLHSKYDPCSEASAILKEPFFQADSVKKNCCFFGLGLGYVTEGFLEKNVSCNVIIVEPDIFIFLLFLNSRNLKNFFIHKKLTLLIGLLPAEVLNFLEGFEKENQTKISKFFLRTSEMFIPSWYKEFKTLQKRSEAKKQINANTEKKFLKIWYKNLIKNFLYFDKKNIFSILDFCDKLKNSTVIIFAAGASLPEHIKSLSTKNLSGVIIVAVDTAVRAILQANIKIDFVISGDPQYVNFQHLKNLNLKDCVLVAEATSYPHILRLQAKATCVFSQRLPIEEKFFTELKKVVAFNMDSLSSGGSVATTSFSFARFLGANKIYFAGLDLSFVKKQTHFRGSTFEELTHTFATRVNSSETQLIKSLFSGKLFFADSNTKINDEKVLTDIKMQMFAWWFESEIAKVKKSIEVYTFSNNGLYIPGISLKNISSVEFKAKENVKLLINNILEKSTPLNIPEDKILLVADKIRKEFIGNF